MTKVFIDGSAGTTGLRIADRLAQRQDIMIVRIAEGLRKDPAARRDAICTADVAFLCLPDDAAREAVALAADADTKIIDTSTAHRTDPAWCYGFPEIGALREKIAEAKWIANPGCHASGFVALVAPLVQSGLLAPDTPLTSFSITGYSGGGKKMIAQYEASQKDVLLNGPRQYALTQQHKHLKEMVHLCGLEQAPVFCPIVGNFYSGMEVTVPVFSHQLKGTMEQVRNLYKAYYHTGLVHYRENADEEGFLSAAAYAGRDDMEISVNGNEERMLLTARFDNLGKGASGAAIQNMNILLGLDEAVGLNVL